MADQGMTPEERARELAYRPADEIAEGMRAAAAELQAKAEGLERELAALRVHWEGHAMCEGQRRATVAESALAEARRELAKLPGARLVEHAEALRKLGESLLAVTRERDEARAALATAAAVLERAASMWPMVPGYEDRAREFGAAAEAAAKAAGGATPMRDALGALGTQIAFLRSCIRSGESLSPADNEQIDAALARAGGEVPAAGGVCADCGPFPSHPHTCALAAPGAGEQRQELVVGMYRAPAPTPKDPEEGR